MYVVYLSCDFVTKMMIKKINLKIWKSSLISGLWFGIVQFLNRNIQACAGPVDLTFIRYKCSFIELGLLLQKLFDPNMLAFCSYVFSACHITSAKGKNRNQYKEFPLFLAPPPHLCQNGGK